MTLQGHYKLKKVKSYFGKEMEIPEEWKLDQIQNHSRIVTGSKNTQDKVYDGKYPFFVRSQKIARINSYSYDGESVLTVGDGKIGEIFHYINGRFDFHQRVYKISDFKTSLDGHFFYYYFSTYFLNRAKSMTAKNTVDSIRMGMIAEMLIPLPPLPEQQKIASILSNVDALIESTQDVVAKSERLKKALMQELLTRGIGHDKFKKVKWYFGKEIDIPEEWEKVKLFENCTGKGEYGVGVSAIEKNSKLPRYIRITDLNDDGSLRNEEWKSISEQDAKNYILTNDDILFARTGATVGKTFLYEKNHGKCAFAGYLIRFKIDKYKLVPKFLFYWTHSKYYWGWLLSIQTWGVQPNVNAEQYSRMPFLFPPLSEQQKIASILSGVDATNYTHIIINTSLCIRLRIILILFTTILYHEFYNTEKDIHNSHNT